MVNFWQISPGREERGLWPKFKKDSIIAIGWDRLGDLKKYSTDKEIENALKKHYPDDYPRDSYPVRSIDQ